MTECFYDILKHISKTVTINGPVIDVGSLIVNDKYVVKDLFGKNYIGIDMRPGTGVDVACNSHLMGIDDNSAGLIICSSMLEHDDDPVKTVGEIKRILRHDGKVFITVPFHWSIHAHPDDYWRFTTNGLVKIMRHTLHCPIQVFSIGPTLKPHTIVGLYGMELSAKKVVNLNKKYPHSSGRLYYLMSLFIPQILISMHKSVRYGRAM